MKRSVFSNASLVLLASSLLFAGCHKNNTPGGNGNPTLNVMYPTQLIYSESGNNNYPFTWTYEYDADNNLVKYGKEGFTLRQISSPGVTATTWNGNTATTFGYTFRYYDNPNGAISFYSGLPPTEVNVDVFVKNLETGVVNSDHYNTFQFTNYSNGFLQSELAFGRNYNYNYDEDENLKEIDYVENGHPYSRIRVVSHDDNPSPFVAIKGYRYASYPQVYVPEICAAFLHNNPIHVVVEDLDPDTNQWKLYEEDDFTYTYNEEGYPTTIQLTITYHTATITHFTKTFNYTYRH